MPAAPKQVAQAIKNTAADKRYCSELIDGINEMSDLWKGHMQFLHGRRCWSTHDFLSFFSSTTPQRKKNTKNLFFSKPETLGKKQLFFSWIAASGSVHGKRCHLSWSTTVARKSTGIDSRPAGRTWGSCEPADQHLRTAPCGENCWQQPHLLCSAEHGRFMERITWWGLLQY